MTGIIIVLLLLCLVLAMSVGYLLMSLDEIRDELKAFNISINKVDKDLNNLMKHE